jgi:hypothetical protein
MYSKTNTDVLAELFPRFAEEILTPFSPAEDAELLSTKTGFPTCKVGGRLLHSRHDPVREAERIIERNYAPEADCIVLLGFGLGYYAEACLEGYPDAHILIVEPDIPLFLASLEARDYTRLWKSARITLLLAAEPGGVTTALNALKARTCQVIALRGIYDLHADYFARIQNAVKAHVSRQQINTNTLKRFGKLWVRNLARNLTSIAGAEDIRTFQDRLEGYPALLLAGGPSLSDILPYLRELKRRFVIVAVDTTLRVCQTAGVRPDVLIIVDPQYWNTRHLDGTSLEDLILVSESSTHSRIFRLFREAALPRTGGGTHKSAGGPSQSALYLCRSLFPLGRYLDDYTGITGKLGAGGSVATTAWDFLRFTGARPIVCAGLDLGFPGKLTHFRGSFFEERSHVLSSRKNPAETHSFAYLRGGDPFPTENYAGGLVLSDRRMALYRGWFEDQLMQHPEATTRVIGRGGVKIEGVQTVDIADLLAYPEVRDGIDEVLASLPHRSSRPTPPEDASRIPFVIRGIESLAAELKALDGTAKRALEAVDDLEKRIRTGDSPAESFAELDRLDREILESSSKDIAGFIMQRTAESIRPVSSEGDEDTRTKAVLENSRRLYSGIVESVDFNLRTLGRALENLKTHPPEGR